MVQGERGGGRGGHKFSHIPGADTFQFQQTTVREAPKLFPPYDLPPLLDLNDTEEELHEIGKMYRQKMQSSVYYLQESQKTSDIERYIDRYKRKDEVAKLSLSSLNLDVLFFPEELRSCVNSQYDVKVKRKKVTKSDILLNIDALGEDDAMQEDEEDEDQQASDAENQQDYDDDEDEGDYNAEQYFEDGDDGGAGMDNFGDGGGDADF